MSRYLRTGGLAMATAILAGTVGAAAAVDDKQPAAARGGVAGIGPPDQPHGGRRGGSRARGYSLQSNRKLREGANHPDRDAQFHYINDSVTAALATGQPWAFSPRACPVGI